MQIVFKKISAKKNYFNLNESHQGIARGLPFIFRDLATLMLDH